jgi:hypothetical protein
MFPGVPGFPDAPVLPGFPGVPGLPVTPVLPGFPDVPGLPVVPVFPGVPGLPAVPVPPVIVLLFLMKANVPPFQPVPTSNAVDDGELEPTVALIKHRILSG